MRPIRMLPKELLEEECILVLWMIFSLRSNPFYKPSS